MTPNFEQEAERIRYKGNHLRHCPADCDDMKLIAQALRKAVSDNDEKWNKANDEMLDKQDAASFKLGFEAAKTAAMTMIEDIDCLCRECNCDTQIYEKIRNLKPEGTK